MKKNQVWVEYDSQTNSISLDNINVVERQQRSYCPSISNPDVLSEEYKMDIKNYCLLEFSVDDRIDRENLALEVFERIKKEMLNYSQPDLKRFRESLLMVAYSVYPKMFCPSDKAIFDKMNELRRLAE